MVLSVTCQSGLWLEVKARKEELMRKSVEKGGQSQDYVKPQEEDLSQTHPKRPDFSNTTMRFASEHPTNMHLKLKRHQPDPQKWTSELKHRTFVSAVFLCLFTLEGLTCQKMLLEYGWQ